MDTQFTWQDEFNIGVDVIDKEHERLFKIINKLYTFKEEEKDSQWTCQEGIKFFNGHTMRHFAEEEAYMASIGYVGLEQHKRIHQGFRENTLPALEQELVRTNYSQESLEHFLGVCAGWLIAHTMTEDLAITGQNMGKWENMLPGEELDSMRKVIVQLMFDMFHLESQLISDNYSGEKFGKGVYYRLLYDTKHDDKRQEIILVFEEKLLINTIGKILGFKSNKLDNMLIHAARYTARQFVDRFVNHFPNLEAYQLQEENLLSYSQFQKLMEKETLQVSLLFNTGGSGYFAFCIIAPHMLEKGVGTPLLEADNAMAEVDKYLAQRQEQEKQDELNHLPKVLVVDDSLTIRQGMKKLLGDDYEVALAESGIAAIRTITLNRPDLVLLDYEMPVCDGRQTLAMLRSDEAFADIPVYFLTSRSDPDSVRNVMALKPTGYLLKNLKPAEIKSKIDAFFANQQTQAADE